MTKNTKFVLERVENIVGKGKDAGYQHFLLFPQCFQNPSHSGSLKEGNRQLFSTQSHFLTTLKKKAFESCEIRKLWVTCIFSISLDFSGHYVTNHNFGVTFLFCCLHML